MRKAIHLNHRTIAALALVFGASIVAAWGANTASPTRQSQAAATPVFGRWGVDLTGIDRNTRPGDNFFRFANGAWYEKALIPADRTSAGAFQDLQIQSEDKVRAIVSSLEMRTTALTPDEQRVRDLYRSYVNTTRLEQLGLAPAQSDLNAIAALRSRDDVARAMGSVGLGVKSLFRTSIGVDDKNPNSYAVFLGQSGLGLPDRDYYLLNDKAIATARQGYQAYIARIFDLAGVPSGAEKAAAIFNLETEIAKLHWTRAERRNADRVYNPMTVSELEQLAPGFPWRVYLSEHGIPGAQDGTRRVIVEENTAFPAFAALFARTPAETWRDYLTFHYLSGHASYLPRRFDDARFDFFGKVLGGQKEQLAREKRGA